MDFHKQARSEACSEPIESHKSDKTFLSRVVTGDETWVHHYEPESKKSSMEWHHPSKKVRNWLKMQPTDFYKAGIVSLVHRWKIGIEKRGDYIEK